MAQVVERLLEATVEQLHRLQLLGILTQHEAKKLSKKRRTFENSVIQKGATSRHYLRYIQYEQNVELLFRRRIKRAQKFRKDIGQREKKQLGRDLALQSSRIFFLYNRATRKFPTDLTLWKEYLRHCVVTESFRLSSRVLGRALARLPNVEELWLLGISLEFDYRHNMRAARILAQRSLRYLEHSSSLWKEYFRLELYYLCRQLLKRHYLQLPIPTTENLAAEQRGNNVEIQDKSWTEYIPTNEEKDDGSAGEALYIDYELDLAKRDSLEPIASITTVRNGSDDKLTEKCVGSSTLSSFWEGGVVQVILNKIIDLFPDDDKLIAELVELVFETPFAPTSLKMAMQNVVFDRFRYSINCRVAVIKRWLHLNKETEAFPIENCIGEWKQLLKDTPKKETLEACLLFWNHLEIEDRRDIESQLSQFAAQLGIGSHLKETQDSKVPIDQLLETWKSLESDSEERQKLQSIIFERFEKETFHSTDGIDGTTGALYLKWIVGEYVNTIEKESESLEVARQVYDRILYLSPNNLSIVLAAIEIEWKMISKGDKETLKRLRRLLESWCEIEGWNNCTCWLNFIRFERMFGDVLKVSEIYWRAMKTLKKTREFMEQYALLCS
eukprot:jgi/Galph1/3018/GphlegSOOS_G1692.1